MERLKFYADTPDGKKNQRFCWTINSIVDIPARLNYFTNKGYYLRAAWYEYVDEETGEKDNQQIDLIEYYEDRSNVLFTKKQL